MSTPAHMIVCEQGSYEWLQARCGLVTASRCADVIAMLKRGGEAADRRNYRGEVICEILTGQPYPRHVTQEMKWGIDQEPFARAAYEVACDVMVDTAGFVPHPTIARFGASPDGFIGDVGMVQFKCPATTTHLAWMLGGVIPVEHMPQMLGEFSCCPGREWCDFVSFDPRLPEHLQLFRRRFECNPRHVAVLEGEVIHFNQEIDQVLAALPQKPQGVVICMDQVAGDELNF